ncbi:MAG TPA: hypothetical protein VF696_02045 [Candidatus Paceibacterota bacterium]|jgi:hypothetical protein
MKTFTNELGNQITVEVVEMVINGVDGVLVRMEGPGSRTEMHITRVEARVLLEQMGACLSVGV